MTVHEFEVDSIEDDSFIKREIKNFIEYEICLRHEKKYNSEFIEKLLRIIKDVDLIEEEAGYDGRFYKLSALLILKAQFGEEWNDIIGFDDLYLQSFFEDVNKYLEFVDDIFEKYKQEIIDCINHLPKLRQYRLDQWRPESDLTEVYYWWCRVMKRNEGLDEKDWVIRSKNKIEESEYNLGEEGFVVVKREVSEDPFPEMTPDALGAWFWDLMKLDEEDRSREIMRQRKDKEFSNNKFSQLLKMFDAWDAAEPRIGFEWDENKNAYFSNAEGMEGLFKKFREVEGDVIMPRQVEPALIGLMCWDTRNRLGIGPRAIQEVQGKILKIKGLEGDGEDKLYGNIENWLDVASGRVKTGEF
ncbi:hypothetical protein B0T40_13370 [Chromobacterium haemolyticum]|uniref:hypothetical protein n=1 Tax=Chromobacterium haemolyticum TaxID=394935 RepID=UPI0009DAF6D1|nr:hypothetical protein [Chromobacterium haemolyticum]OQS35152.1 hypothetical protein B0T40_13370 [Chromobacterium haemolyticum]